MIRRLVTDASNNNTTTMLTVIISKGEVEVGEDTARTLPVLQEEDRSLKKMEFPVLEQVREGRSGR